MLRKLAGTISASEIGKRLGRTKDSVKAQLHRWKLPTYVVVYEKKVKPEEVVPTPVEPPKAVPVPLRKVDKPALRQKAPSREWPPLEYCPECHAPVSNWTEHHARMPECRKRA